MPKLKISKAMPLVTTIIPAFNHEKYVEKSLLSVLEQTYDKIEVIIIDDGSTDKTAAIIDNILREFEHNRDVTFIRQANQGLSRTLNKALSLAKGELVQFLASDDAYLPEKTAVCVQALLSTPENVAAVYSDGFIINDQDEKIMLYSDKYLRPLSKDTYKELLIRNWIPAHGLLYKKSAFERIGGFDETIAVEDYEFLLRLTKVFQIVSVSQKLFLYRWHNENFSKNQERMASQFELICKKHPDLLNYNKFKDSLYSTSLLRAVKYCSFKNLDLLRRSFIKRIQKINQKLNGVKQANLNI